MSPAPPLDPIATLRTTGEDITDDLYDSILALGDAAVVPLLAILEDDELAMEDAPGDGWPPVHAVNLLADLKAEAAITPMLRILCEADEDSILFDHVVLDLPRIGPAVLEPALTALDVTNRSDTFEALCFVLAGLGVRDERIFAALVELFNDDPVLGAMCFADYGDTRALPMIEGSIIHFVPDWGSAMGARDLVEYVDAYERIAGGPMPAAPAERVRVLRAEWQRRWDDRGNARSTKVGRNDPCPCGSGKKSKKCCDGKVVAG